MAAANFVPASTSMFVNVHPNVFNSGAPLSKTVLMQARQWEVDVDRLVLEITEQGSLNRTPAVLETFAELRDLGIRFAFDDVGVAYSHLPFIGDVRPAFLKISQHFGTAFETDMTRMKIVT